LSFICLALAGTAGRAGAQGVDASAEASHSLRPSVRLDGTDGTDLSTQAIQVRLNVRAKLEPRTVIIAGVAYHGSTSTTAGRRPSRRRRYTRSRLPWC
jgi:hypothetical protein